MTGLRAVDGQLSIRVVGVPAPQGSKRHVGHGVMVESSQRVRPWREAVAYATLRDMRAAQHPGFPTGAIAVRVVFFLPRPASLPKRVAWPSKRPDLDKLIRATFDGLTESGVWRDDSQVVQVTARKTYAQHGQPLGARIEIGGQPT